MIFCCNFAVKATINLIGNRIIMRIEYVFPQSFNPDDVDIRLQYISVSPIGKND